VPPLLLLFFGFDLFDGVALAAVDAGTFLADVIPGVWISEIAVPERPCAALVWPDRVDFADLVAVDRFEEDAVIYRAPLNDSGALADAHEVLLSKFVPTDFEVVGDKANFFLCNPDISFIGPGTTVSTLAALKTQAADIPRIFGTGLHKEIKRYNYNFRPEYSNKYYTKKIQLCNK
jgi:hypothetical protein